jgi:hypothetical protein
MNTERMASFKTGGPVDPTSPVYVERRCELDATRHLQIWNTSK